MQNRTPGCLRDAVYLRGGILLLVAPLLASVGCGGAGGGGGSPPPVTPATCTALASNLSMPPAAPGFALSNPILDSTNVYWYESDPTQGNTPGSIRTVSKNGGPVTVLATGLGGVNAMAVDSANVYWTEYDLVLGSGAIKAAPKTGGTVTVLASGTPPGSGYDVFYPVGITFDSTYVYWGEGVGGGAIRRVPKTGGNQVVDIGRGQGSVGWLAIDSGSTFFYYYNGGGGLGAPPNNTIFSRLPFNGGTAQVLTPYFGQNIVGGIALDSNFVYWVDVTDPATSPPNGGTVFEVPIGGGAPTYLVSNLHDPHNLAIDANYVYYIGGVSPGPGMVSKVAKTGGTSTVYPNCVPCPPPGCTAVLGGIGFLAVDNTDVYVFGGPPGVQQATTSILAKFPK